MPGHKRHSIRLECNFNAFNTFVNLMIKFIDANILSVFDISKLRWIAPVLPFEILLRIMAILNLSTFFSSQN